MTRFTDSGNGFYWLESPAFPPFIQDLKAKVPTHLRQWDPGSRRWMLDPAAVVTVADLSRKHFGQTPAVPPVAAAQALASPRFFRVVYVGSPKYREDGSYTATAYCEDEYGRGDWKLVLPVGVMRAFFEGTLADLFQEQQTESEWALLGLDPDATYTDDEVRLAARKAMGAAHPDKHGGTKDAHEHFIKVQDAADVLKSARNRKLLGKLAAEFEKARLQKLADLTQKNPRQYAYVPPMRTGWMLVEGANLLGGKQILVSKIVGFEEITDDYGRVLQGYIPRGAHGVPGERRTPVAQWVTP